MPNTSYFTPRPSPRLGDTLPRLEPREDWLERSRRTPTNLCSSLGVHGQCRVTARAWSRTPQAVLARLEARLNLNEARVEVLVRGVRRYIYVGISCIIHTVHIFNIPYHNMRTKYCMYRTFTSYILSSKPRGFRGSSWRGEAEVLPRPHLASPRSEK